MFVDNENQTQISDEPTTFSFDDEAVDGFFAIDPDNYAMTQQEQPEAEQPDQVEPEPEKQEPESEPESEQEPEPEPEQEPEQPEEDEKPKQTPEENRYWAEKRRQSLREQVRQEVIQEMLNRPEFKVAQMLSEQLGLPPDQLLQKIEEARIQREAQQRGIPVEVMRQIHDAQRRQAQLERELNLLRFENWRSRVENEAAQIKQRFPMLTDQDIEDAKIYLLRDLRNPELPLEKAVYALHAQKIIESLQNSAKTEALAEISGRKNKSPLPPQGKKAETAPVLTEEERHFAKVFGISEEEWAKWKNKTSL